MFLPELAFLRFSTKTRNLRPRGCYREALFRSVARGINSVARAVRPPARAARCNSPEAVGRIRCQLTVNGQQFVRPLQPCSRAGQIATSVHGDSGRLTVNGGIADWSGVTCRVDRPIDVPHGQHQYPHPEVYLELSKKTTILSAPDMLKRLAAVQALSALSLPVGSPRKMKLESLPNPTALMPRTRR